MSATQKNNIGEISNEQEKSIESEGSSGEERKRLHTVKESVFAVLIENFYNKIKHHSCAYCGESSSNGKEGNEEDSIQSLHHLPLIHSLLTLGYSIRFAPITISLSWVREVGVLCLTLLQKTRWISENEDRYV
jgi:hypothetical protein